MRKNTIIIFSLIVIFIFQGCKKDQEFLNENISLETKHTNNSSNFIFSPLKKSYGNDYFYSIKDNSILNLLRNPSNKEDENMFYQVYLVAQNFKNCIPNERILNFVYDNLKKNKKSFIDYQEIINYDNKFNLIKADSLIYSYNILLERMIYKGEYYNLELYVPNIKTADLTKLPIIAIGTDLYTDNDNLNDYIPAWYINNSTSEEILINETEAMKSISPVIIFSIFKKSETPSIEEKEEFVNNQTKGTDIYHVFMDDCSISEKYENDNKSEFAFGFRIVSGNPETNN